MLSAGQTSSNYDSGIRSYPVVLAALARGDSVVASAEIRLCACFAFLGGFRQACESFDAPASPVQSHGSVICLQIGEGRLGPATFAACIRSGQTNTSVECLQPVGLVTLWPVCGFTHLRIAATFVGDR